ncbi:g7846 [Coccomyxa elongata]
MMGWLSRDGAALLQLQKAVTLLLLVLGHSRSIRSENEGGLGKHGMEQKAAMENEVRNMIEHAFDNYMSLAFPHDELKPISQTYTDSLGELGNVKGLEGNKGYSGVALTLIDSLSTLAVIGDAVNFEESVLWLSDNLSFDVDVRVNVFEANIRLLGGLLSAHLLAEDSVHGPKLMQNSAYSGGLLDLALDLGRRLLPAFAASPTGLPYAWVNLRHGVFRNETEVETNTAACGSFTIEMGVLSRLTGIPEFEFYAKRSLQVLWSMRTPLGLFGTALDMQKGVWLDPNGGIGASADSFYEYLLKAYILFGEVEYWDMFRAAYTAAIRYYKDGRWYPSADIWSGTRTHLQFTSLQAFWPGMQVLAGDVSAAADSFRAFFGVWERFGLLPERYLYGGGGALHPTEQYYPLRPELVESAFYLHQATGEDEYLRAGEKIMESLNRHTRVEGGFASVRSVASMEKEDHMHSFFLAETCKYLFLLSNDTFWRSGNYIFSTEGHPIPVGHPLMRRGAPQCRAGDDKLPTQRFQQASGASITEAGEASTSLRDKEMSGEAAAVTAPAAEHGTEGGGASEGGVLVERGDIEGHGAGVGASGELLGVSEAGEEPQCREAVSARREHRFPLYWGWLHSNASALDALVCPDFTQDIVVSACHIRDAHAGHACAGNADCGVDGASCRRRTCSEHGVCHVLEQVQRSVVIQHINQPVVIHHVGHPGMQVQAVKVQNGQLQGVQVQGMPVQGVAGQQLQGLMKVIVQMQQHLQHRLTASTNAGGTMQQSLQPP